jgi:cytochrome c oxidase subunit 2
MKHYLIVGVLTVVLTLAVGFGLMAVNLTPDPSSVQAGPIDSMIHLQTWLIAFLFSLITVFIAYSAFAFSRKDKMAYGAPFKSSTRLEVAWTLIPLVTVLVLAFIGAQDLSEVRREEPNALEIKVTAFQWGWLFEYPEWGIQSNTMYMPVDRQARVTLTSRDVSHSFWVPEFRVKQDALPGANLVKEMRITPTRTGEFKVRCAEMCGGAHALMESPVVVVAQNEFNAWVDEQTNAADMPPEQRGQRIATTQGCITCHSLDGSRVVGPTWKGLYGAQIPLADGSTVAADDEYLYAAIVDPNAQIHQGYPPNVMQSYKEELSDEQIRDIIEFIKTVQ